MMPDSSEPQLPNQNDESTIPSLPSVSPNGRSRRDFLRNAVIASAATATVVGASAAIIEATPLGPKLMSRIAVVAAVVSPGCIPLKQGSKGSPNNPNQILQVDIANASFFGTLSGTTVGSTLTLSHTPFNITLTAKAGGAPVLTTVVTGGEVANGNVLKLFITPGVTGEYPEGSCITIL